MHLGLWTKHSNILSFTNTKSTTNARAHSFVYATATAYLLTCVGNDDSVIFSQFVKLYVINPVLLDLVLLGIL